MKKENKQKNSEPSFDQIIFLLDIELRSLKQTLPHLNSLLDMVINKQVKDLESFTSEIKGTEITPDLRITLIERMDHIRKSTLPMLIAPKKLNESYLNSLVVSFEGSLANLIRAMFYTNSGLLERSEKSISYVDLMRFKSLNDSKKYIVDREIDDVLRKNVFDIFEWIGARIGMNIIEKIEKWTEFVEIQERRNVLVHNNGIVNDQYLRSCQKSGTNSSVKLGEKLYVDENYFNASCETILEVSIILVQLVRRKLEDDLKKADDSLEGIAYDLLENENYSLAIRIFDFALKYYKKQSGESFRLRMLINKAIAYKFNKNNKVCLDLINEEDWSAKSDEYKLAVLVLKDNFKSAADLMLKISKDKISKDNYRKWPLFKEFRKSNFFLISYKKMFKEEFSIPEKYPERIEELVKALKKVKSKNT